jgi:hypothetical protein
MRVGLMVIGLAIIMDMARAISGGRVHCKRGMREKDVEDDQRTKFSFIPRIVMPAKAGISRRRE